MSNSNLSYAYKKTHIYFFVLSMLLVNIIFKQSNIKMYNLNYLSNHKITKL